MKCPIILTVIALVSFGTAAFAEAPVEAPRSTREISPHVAEDADDFARHAVEGFQVGLGAPLGYAGASYEHHFFSWLALHGGVGANARGGQLTAGLRLRLPLGSWSLGVTGNTSFGNANLAGFEDEKEVTNALWIGGDAFIERRSRPDGLIVRLFVGEAVTAAVGSCTLFIEGRATKCSGGTIPYVGLATGWGF